MSETEDTSFLLQQIITGINSYVSRVFPCEVPTEEVECLHLSMRDMARLCVPL